MWRVPVFRHRSVPHPRWEAHRYPALVTGALVATPGAIQEEARQLDVEIRALRDEVLAQALALGKTMGEKVKEDPRWSFYMHDLLPFLQEWDKFYADHQHWIENLWGSTWEQIQAYRTRLLAFRESARHLGYVFAGPAPTPAKEAPAEAVKSLVGGLGRTGIMVALGVGAAVLLVSQLRK